ncbi:MAG: ligase-associated DNA damage response exonuclease [Planctomycetota bacterium]
MPSAIAFPVTTCPIHADHRGIACPAGDFWIDPWKPVDTAVVTHAHADHARPGSKRYFAAEPSVPILRLRLQKGADITGIPYGQPFTLGDTQVSFHPAGHCFGSAQVRVEHAGHVAVAAGDYKRERDPTCDPFEVIPCDTFITEATFALPVYRWDDPAQTADDILDWWLDNQARKRVSVLACYALGKAQRLLGMLAERCDARGIARKRVFVHGALDPLIGVYRDAGIDMLDTWKLGESGRAKGKVNPFRGELILCPPSAIGSPWMKRFGKATEVDAAMASGWMRVRGVRRRRGYDRGFVLSDHADWNDLVRTCQETGASKVYCTHGNTDVLSKHLQELGIDAEPLETEFGDDDISESSVESGTES